MQDQHALQSGTMLDRYKIIRVLGEGGFGITYLAEDIHLGLKVVIKEYFPNEFAMRSGDSTITAKRKSTGDFSKGKQRFKEEAQILAKFNHPSIVKISGYFEANDTAYFVMEYEEGLDLSHYLKQQNKALTQEEVLSIMMPILEGLKEVHRYNYLHRDIKPGNILLRSNKSPVLIDFGASKLVLGEASKSITSMLTEGYAPLEQYSTDIKQQGAFTDLYAVAAVMYKMITGEVPPSAQTRSYALLSGGDDPYKSLSTLKLSKYDNNFLKAVDRALDINANNRPQNVQEFQEDIVGKLKAKRESPNQPSKGVNSNRVIVIVSLLALLIIIGGGYFIFNQNDNANGIEKDIPSTNISYDQNSYRTEGEKAKKKIETERLKKEEEIEKLRKEKSQVQHEELKQLRKEKVERENAKREAEKLTLEKLAVKKLAKEQLVQKEAERIRLEKERASQEFPLTIRTTPLSARVQIMNIKPKYYDGIKLKRGKYKIRVSKRGYKSVNINVNPADGSGYNVILEKSAIVKRVSEGRSVNSGVANCTVTIFQDGSIGAKRNGYFRQWKNMSNSAKKDCQSALNRARRK